MTLDTSSQQRFAPSNGSAHFLHIVTSQALPRPLRAEVLSPWTCTPLTMASSALGRSGQRQPSFEAKHLAPNPLSKPPPPPLSDTELSRHSATDTVSVLAPSPSRGGGRSAAVCHFL
ncbi:hypothetical protein N657DRAFT_649507 [Parathielavia appendiculata]|uniref:Uncharacterized protein n=1 Tax=Parathielavia appendiculata TaxID=2587402 RepID=A0AAN6TU25_9PEZI|nr:hypothetical protein N657DRAFT_649507 [Parathielavia appendiculata]